MRLIDADELKKKAKMIDWLCNKQVVSVEDIDNAPTVNITALCPVDFPTIDDPYPCCSYKRPKGEWKLIRVADHYGIHDSFVCPFCNYEREYRKKNYCEECGADMRGGAE